MKTTLTLLFALCAWYASGQAIENDDVYYNKDDRKVDTVVVTARKRHLYQSNGKYQYYTIIRDPFYGYNGGFNQTYGYPYEYYRGRTIVVTPIPPVQVTPKYKYGKRPSRELRPTGVRR